MARLNVALPRALDPNANPSNGGKLYTYLAGTSTTVTTYADPAMTSPQRHPVIADSAGNFAEIYVPDGDYKIVIATSADVTLRESDNVVVSSLPAAATRFSGPSYSTDTTLSYAAGAGKYKVVGGDIVEFDAHFYRVDPLVAIDNHVTTAGGVKLKVLRGELGYHVDAFGPVKGKAGDATDAIEKAAGAVAAEGGGAMVFGQGIYRTLREITIPTRQLNMFGTGRRMPYPGPNLKDDEDGPTTIFADHTGRNAFKFVHTTEQSTGFYAEGINVVTNDVGQPNRVFCAFGFDCGGTAALFQRDFTFYRCGVFNFTSAFDLYNSGASTLLQMGVLKIINCTINRNDWIARTLDTTNWNGFTFRDNEAGQNNVGGINVEAHSFICEDNLMEGQPNPVAVLGAYRNIIVKGNYFEAVTGKACIDLQQCIGPMDIGPNLYIAVSATHKVLLSATGNANCLDPYWPEGVINTPMPLLGKANGSDTERVLNNSVTTDQFGFYRTDKADLAQFLKKPVVISEAAQRVTIAARQINPANGDIMPVQEYVTSGSGSVALTYSIPGGLGNWAVMSWLMRQGSDASDTANPYVSFAVNGVAGNGGRDYDFSHLNHVIQGDWVLLTAAISLLGDMTTLDLSLFPFGVNPAAGRTAQFLRPYVYTTDNVNRIRPYIDPYIANSVTASPTVGTWNTGDMVRNATPSANNQGWFVCSAGGTPGTWIYG